LKLAGSEGAKGSVRPKGKRVVRAHVRLSGRVQTLITRPEQPRTGEGKRGRIEQSEQFQKKVIGGK